MARPREFDNDKVIALAEELFRRKGYGATSMRDLIAHVGLSSSSIYAAFGGKYGLFIAALRHGAAQDRAMIVQALAHPDGVMAGVASLYHGLIDKLLAEDGATASLTLRAALESLDAAAPDTERSPALGSRTGADVKVMDVLRAHFADLSDVLSERLEQAHSRQELRLNQDASDLALFILLNAFNLTFVVKLTRDEQRLAAYVQAALDAVTGQPTGAWAERGSCSD